MVYMVAIVMIETKFLSTTGIIYFVNIYSVFMCEMVSFNFVS